MINELEKNPNSPISQKLLHPYKAREFAISCVKNNMEIPEKIVDVLCKSPEFSYYVIIDFLDYEYDVTLGYRNLKPNEEKKSEIPEKLLLSVAQHDAYAQHLSIMLIERSKLIPLDIADVLIQSPNHCYSYTTEVLLPNRIKPSETFIRRISEDPFTSLNFARTLIKAKLDVPDIIFDAIIKDEDTRTQFAVSTVASQWELPDKFIHAIATDSYDSYRLVHAMLYQGRKDISEVPKELINAVAKDEADSFKLMGYLQREFKMEVPPAISNSAKKYFMYREERFNENYFEKLYKQL